MAFHCIRITTSGEKSFEDVYFLTYEEQVNQGIPQVFGESPRNRDVHDQIAWKCKEGVFICDVEDILIIQLDTVDKVRKKSGHWIQRIAIGDLTFHDVKIFAELDEALEAGFPNLLGEDQISLFTKEGRFVSHDANCVIIQVR